MASVSSALSAMITRTAQTANTTTIFPQAGALNAQLLPTATAATFLTLASVWIALLDTIQTVIYFVLRVHRKAAKNAYQISSVLLRRTGSILL